MKKTFDWFINFIAWSFFVTAHVKAEKYFLTDSNGASGLSESWKPVVFNSSYTCSNSWTLPSKSGIPIDWYTCLPSSSSKAVQYCVLKSSVYNLNGANAVFINITLKITPCKSLKTTSNCHDSFTFSIYTGSLDDPPNKLSFETTLPNNSAQFSGDSEYVTSDLITFSDTEGKNKMQLEFSTTNFCGSLKELSMYAYRCPSSTNNLASFLEEAAPNRMNSPRIIFGECLENSISENKLKPSIECYFNGTYKVYSECKCSKGYEPKTFSCKACDSNHFKPSVGNIACEECGSNSIGVLSSCTCLPGFYRILNEEMNSSAACYKPTSPPQNVTIYNITENSAFVAWAIPNDESLFDGYYYIECLSCSVQDIFPRNTTEQQIILDGLGSFSDYNLTISYINSISSLTGRYNKHVFNFKTKPGAPGVVRDVTVKIKNDGSVTISWLPPFWKGGDNLKYILKYNSFPYVTADTYFDINPGAQDKSYTIEIVGVVTIDGVQHRGPIHKETVVIKGSIKLDVLIGTTCGAIAFILIVLIIVFITWKKLHLQYSQAVRLEDGRVKMPANQLMNRGKSYIDPTTYNKVEDAVQQFAFELDRKNVKSGHLLGGGEFAEVYKGTLLQNGESIDVAIKMLKSGATKNDRADFFGEAAILGQFNNQNVIHLHGVILKDRPNIIVLEFMVNGALDKFLQENDMQFTILQLLGMARGVASGMKYLSEMGFIHRDLAARNVLVDEVYCCKVADFGMSRKINFDDSYDTKGGKIPVRWTAPESVQFKKFTSASDVWSYGVLLWEIVSYGERPYWDWGNYEVLERINSGYRLPPPMGSPKVLHNLMLQCWDKDRLKRPKFSEIVPLLEDWIRNPELLAEAASSIVTKSDENLDCTVLESIGKWLQAIGMEKYLKNFTEKGISTPRQVLGLTFEDLEEIGIGPVGHRKKIFKAIQSTRVQIESIESC